MTYARLEDLPNVGPRVAARLRALGVAAPADLAGEDAEALFERSSALAGRPEDPCLLDTYASAIDAAAGAPPRPWWQYSRERKRAAAARAADRSAAPVAGDRQWHGDGEDARCP